METLSKNTLNQLRRYLKKKERKKERKCLLEGEKIITEAVKNGFAVEILVYAQGLGKNIRTLLENPRIKDVRKTDHSTLQKLSDLETSPGVIGLVHVPEPEKQPGEIPAQSRYIALDRISDPNNLGAIIRTASWYGWEGIICSTGCVEILNGKVIRSSMGSVFHIPVWESINLNETVTMLKEKGYTIYGSGPTGGVQVYSAVKRAILIIGNEADGISERTLDMCDYILTIPGEGKAESLNAAVSAGILLDRFSRIFHKQKQ